jgi:hypothetical protein
MVAVRGQSELTFYESAAWNYSNVLASGRRKADISCDRDQLPGAYRHGEERSDEAIQVSFATNWIASLRSQ